MALPSLAEVVLVSQEEIRVETFFRQPDGIWGLAVYAGLDAVMRLRSIELNVPLRDFYSDVELAPPTPPPPWSAARIREDDPLYGRYSL